MEDLNKQDLATTTSQIDSEISEIQNYWTCDACDGDSETDYLMSDLQDCVRG